ncbi:MAG: tetratricopeptide repeat protein [Proteobacteria bacterium]|nr:tetratricopeptide repeat protein [Pseudomonadota bacterium]
MRSILKATVLAVAVGVSAPAFAAGGGGSGTSMDTPSAKPADPNYANAKKMIEARNYAGAMPLLQQVVASDPKNADAYNLMGYATRKSGNPNGALQYYNTALGLDPKHIGAHEYIGEAYLQLDRLPEAEQHLARLDQLCTFGCTEYRELKAAIANYKAGKKPTN